MEDLLRAALMNALTASALAVVVAGLSLILSRRPALVHCLWMIVLAKLAAPPLFEAPLGSLATGLETVWREAPAAPEPIVFTLAPTAAEPETTTLPPLESFAAIADEPKEHAPSSIEWSVPWRALGLVWLLGAIAAASVAVVRVVRFQRLLKGAEPAGDSVEAEIAGLAARMGLKRRPRAVLVEGRVAPMLWAVGRDPRLVLPRQLWKSLNGRQRSLLLTHELAHWKRGDHRVRLLELAVTAAYWWLPVVWLVRRALRDAEEQCCDAWVVWMFPDDARTYAETLLDAVDFLNPVAQPEPLLASGFGKATHLRRRLVMVMRGTTPRSLGWTGTLGALALAGILLPTSPIWAQKDDSIEFKGDVTVSKAKPNETVIVGEARWPFEPTRIVIRADEGRKEAIQKAVEQLKTQTKAIAEKEDATDEDRLQEKTLRKLVDQLEAMERSNSRPEAVTIEADSILVHGQPKGGPKEIEAARKRVEELQKEANELHRRHQEKQAEVGRALRKLNELQGEALHVTRPLQLRPATINLRSQGSAATVDQNRLDQLENKLSKVLEELEGLKKRKAEDGDKE